MKFTAKRLIGAGVIGIAAIVAPISLTAGLPILSSGPASVASAAGGNACPSNANSEVVCYVQSPTSPVDTFQDSPAGSNTPTVQTATVSGNCATVPAPAAAFLQMCGFVYPSSDYSGVSKAASLGTNGTATGVGGISPSWTIDNKTSGNKSQAEAIDFSPGSGVANGSVFTDAQIQVQRKDTGVAQNPSVKVQLAEIDPSTGNWVTQDCLITGNTGTQITADTDSAGVGGNCGPASEAGGGSAPPEFGTVEVRDLTVSTSISVVNTSTFTLSKTVCGTKTIPATVLVNGAPNANLTLNEDPSVCKPYTNFTSTIVAGSGQSQIEFDAIGTTALHFTLQMTWPVQAYCTPQGSNGTPVCAEDQVNFVDPFTNTVFNGTPAYCVSSVGATLPGNPLPNSPDDPYCTLSKTFNYSVNYNGTGQGTQITVTMSSLLDLIQRH